MIVVSTDHGINLRDLNLRGSGNFAIKFGTDVFWGTVVEFFIISKLMAIGDGSGWSV